MEIVKIIGIIALIIFWLPTSAQRSSVGLSSPER